MRTVKLNEGQYNLVQVLLAEEMQRRAEAKGDLSDIEQRNSAAAVRAMRQLVMLQDGEEGNFVALSALFTQDAFKDPDREPNAACGITGLSLTENVILVAAMGAALAVHHGNEKDFDAHSGVLNARLNDMLSLAERLIAMYP